MTHPFNCFLSLVDSQPDAAAIVQGDTTVSRAALSARAGELAQGLARRGITPDRMHRVLINVPNSPDMVALVLAIWAQGGLPMFLSAKSPEQHLRAILDRLKPDLTVDEALLASLPQPGHPLPRPELTGDRDGSVVFTSGSSGPPKGVVQKAATLVSGVGRVARTLGYAPQERILVPIPFAHDYGWGQMLSGLVAGHILILPRRDILVEVSRAVTEQQPTIMAGVPSLYAALLFGISDFENARTDSLRLLVSTGSAFSPALHQALAARIPQARILRNYGLTETYRGCCLLPEDATAHPGSSGRPIDGVRIMIAGPAGRPLPPGAEGEIVHCGAGVFDRYLDDPEATERTRRMIDGAPAVFTGDIGHLDADGYLYIAGRRDRLVKSMDIRTNLGDVETALSALLEVAEAAVLTRPHPMSGVEIVAFCIPGGEATERTILRVSSRNLAMHMRPRRVICLTEMPRTPVGKVDYPALQKLLDTENRGH